MVMMHELAHCLQMNHSRKFWEVRNGFAAEMYGLWAKGYTGEGVWGRGRELSGGEWDDATAEWDQSEMPANLCGGTFRSRRRKRVRKGGNGEELTNAEKKARRIEKKFGKNGAVLGEDEGVRTFLEGGKVFKGKPRVAQSNRGRELRANAAIARFGQQKFDEEVEKLKSDGEETGSGSDYVEDEMQREDALDLNGLRLLDSQGQGMVKVCGDEDADDVQVKAEMDELQSFQPLLDSGLLSRTTRKPPQSTNGNAQEETPTTAPPPKIKIHRNPPGPTSKQSTRPSNAHDVHVKQEMDELQDPHPILHSGLLSETTRMPREATDSSAQQNNTSATASRRKITIHRNIPKPASNQNTISDSRTTEDYVYPRQDQERAPREPTSFPSPVGASQNLPSQSAELLDPTLPLPQDQQFVQNKCPVCSMENDAMAWLCAACSHVLRPQMSSGSWKCASTVCKDGQYLNPGDFGVCGVCGERKPA